MATLHQQTWKQRIYKFVGRENEASSNQKPQCRHVLENKSSPAKSMISLHNLGQPQWAPRNYLSFATEGYAQNAICYRCVRMISEAAASIPFKLIEQGETYSEHPLLSLLNRPNKKQCGPELLEQWYGHLLVAGNSYMEVVSLDETPRELYALRPDRLSIIPGSDGWPQAYEYTVGGDKLLYPVPEQTEQSSILHQSLFHPTNDHYGMSPIEAAATAIDIHNAASKWNKALLDNSARPSGALIYTANDGQLNPEQYERLQAELKENFEGASNAGKPLLLEGGLDWKNMGLTPRDMDFIEAKYVAAREISLALGVPPMLLAIPGDNTYSNYAEANRSFWRQTVLPLAEKAAKSLSYWLRPSYGANIKLQLDLENVVALADEREAIWNRISNADFLTIDEKRALIGYQPLGENSINKNQLGQA